MNYLLIGSKEGGSWKDATLFCTGTIDKIQEFFKTREKPFILWYLIDTSQLSQNYNDYKQLDLLFFDAQEKHPDLVDKDYKYDPFVGFYDMVATSKSWGLFKKFIEAEKPVEL
ncbi:hypothetical protein COY13_01260 [Candidatus Roizmanbacteria bacterium CG_4_10_14_0_2_um_filter_36_35]|uniref:Uncharacterized protein n=4 Tax=Candidatus Roizmaniibacteriota TaxID=1752723 RepID=A0A2M7BXV1_9BACT|nr:MAG: hypothetical protein COV86_00695 [Candidatus Roizmanbacteria bacterium CG11_big_fil_rev_8_21_14_0_20_35_14]PIV11396.1 MAG: hypothetical protein COS50_00310 [Candidatus Roizmanbacteria bacterium CG03_land_8_20_14_0_80_35_26]PIZ68441.1 MAG: hypothetical protein COY13_01260 [Candidatus Roizmanbacteria bacterium CG_4_10_14_0_2_um_filter_36_35]PJC31255.1 MAG: hypothetical protein CO049_04420 [Candidatus Roizmanbacteria bacterium CG_4_9_14_0_2_um_filter_36_12]